MKVKWDGVKSLPEPRCITSTSPLCLCANYLDKLVCCDLLGNSAGRFPPSYCQTAHVKLGCFTWSFCRQWFVQRVCASCTHEAPSSTGVQRWWDGWASEPAAVPAEKVGWQVGADMEEAVPCICSLCLLSAKVVLAPGSPCTTAQIKCLEMSLPSWPLDQKHINRLPICSVSCLN